MDSTALLLMDSLSKRLYRYSNWRSVAATTLVYALFLSQVMVPHAAEMRSFAGEWGAPDGHLFYTPGEMYAHISTWGTEGRNHYVRFRLGLDPLWAFTYTAFLIALSSVALRKSTPESDPRRRLNLVPLIPMCADLLENALGIVVVSSIPTRLDWLAGPMGVVSLTKWASLAVAHLILLYSLLLAGRTMVRRG